MKLFVVNPNTKEKIYLNIVKPTRKTLAEKIGGHNFYIGNNLYSIDNVRAENNSNSTATGAVVGGVIGALGGPIGIAVGGFLGGLIGNSTDKDESINVRKFNRS
jgi:uncharacterized protein YcfJ